MVQESCRKTCNGSYSWSQGYWPWSGFVRTGVLWWKKSQVEYSSRTKDRKKEKVDPWAGGSDDPTSLHISRHVSPERLLFHMRLILSQSLTKNQTLNPSVILRLEVLSEEISLFSLLSGIRWLSLWLNIVQVYESGCTWYQSTTRDVSTWFLL